MFMNHTSLDKSSKSNYIYLDFLLEVHVVNFINLVFYRTAFFLSILIYIFLFCSSFILGRLQRKLHKIDKELNASLDEFFFFFSIQLTFFYLGCKVIFSRNCDWKW